MNTDTTTQVQEEAIQAIEEAGHNLSAIQAWIGNSPTYYKVEDWEDWIDEFEDSYAGEFNNEQDFATQLLEDTGMFDGLPEFAVRYFDYELFTRDIFSGDYWSAIDPETYLVHIFRNN